MIRRKLLSLSILIVSIIGIMFISGCDNLTDNSKCECPNDWSYSFKTMKKGISGILTIEQDKNKKAMVYEQYVGNDLVACIWPPKPLPWPWPWPSPFPKPWPNPWPWPDFKLSTPPSDSLLAAVTTSPLVICIIPKDTTNKSGDVTILLKIGDKTFSGPLKIWDTPYTKQEWYQFILRNSQDYLWQWEAIPQELMIRMTNYYGFSQNSLGKTILPKDVSFGQLALWESGYTDSPYTPIDEGEAIMAKFPWKFLICAVVTGGSDLLSPAATGAVGTANAAILTASAE